METIAARHITAGPICRHLRASCRWRSTICFPIAETLQLLRFAEIAEGDIRLTDGRQALRRTPIWTSARRLFAQHLLAYVPLAAHQARAGGAPAHRAPASRFRDELEDHMSKKAADQTLRAVISWARYGEASPTISVAASSGYENSS